MSHLFVEPRAVLSRAPLRARAAFEAAAREQSSGPVTADGGATSSLMKRLTNPGRDQVAAPGPASESVARFSTSIIAEMRTFEDYIESLLNGSSDVFVCYDHVAVPTPLDLSDFIKIDLATTRILPYMSIDLPDVDLTSAQGPTIPMLAYSPSTYMSRIVDYCLEDMPCRNRLETVYRASLAESVFTATREGLGLSWLPQNVAPSTPEDSNLKIVSDEYSTSVKITAFAPVEPQSKMQERILRQLMEDAELDPDR